jgi:hypothetical protein
MPADSEEQNAKRAKLAPAKPELLTVGTHVIYDGGKCGVIRSAFGIMDEFWIADLDTNELVRGPDGDIKQYKSAQLSLMPDEGKQNGRDPGKVKSSPLGTEATRDGAARILVVGAENHMMQILENFGAPDYSERSDPALMLAIPTGNCKCAAECNRYDPNAIQMCSPACPLLSIAEEGVDDGLYELAKQIRPDIEIKVRVYHLKQAIEQIGPDLARLESYYCLSALSLPFGTKDILKCQGPERYYREDIRCQLDLGVSAVGVRKKDERLEDAANRALREACRIQLAPSLFSDEHQAKLREQLRVDVPLKLWDGDVKVFIVIIPKDAVSSAREDGVLVFDRPVTKVAELNATTPVVNPSAPRKDVTDWRRTQDEFRHLGKLPAPWIFVRSTKDKNVIYYLNTKTHETRMERPLPDGWTKQTSKSNGKTYYFNAKLKKSMYDFPPP